MDLKAIKDRIRGEKLHTDVAEACRRAGVTDSVFRNAMARDKFDDLEPGQIRVLTAMVDILEEREVARKRLATPC
jgi:hypothetical protein